MPTAGLPVHLDTFVAYGLAFRERMLPELEDKQVVSLERAPEGFVLGLENGETVTARRVVLAVGITHFEYVPEKPRKSCRRNSYRIAFVTPTRRCSRGRNVVVIGGGASAIDLAALAARGGCRRTTGRPPAGIEVSQHADGQAAIAVAADSASEVGSGPGIAVAFLCRCPGFVPPFARAVFVWRSSKEPWVRRRDGSSRTRWSGSLVCSDTRRSAPRSRTARFVFICALRTVPSARS